ncbi:uncharacterized protein N7496_007415 [Penicillium cataractarum]|uniref:Uncharacterized protein n=1 Tax=Penicillium cataractarum TaxID=2100454 RepID=A0A9W9S827_9EURO|nr:uncharacterized protein N7496_007415 [Penicillium cataractarum]KAJ5371323.1 hypothetical protein N7496_007415 [Penicillium cataractarum]
MFAKLRLNNNDDKYPKFRLTIPAHVEEVSEETEKSTGASAIIKGLEVRSPTTTESVELPKPEDPVNASLVALLRAVCMEIPTPLQWKSSKPSFAMTQGKARITSVVDGHLSQFLDSESSSNATLKVKPYLLRSDNFGNIPRQAEQGVVQERRDS